VGGVKEVAREDVVMKQEGFFGSVGSVGRACVGNSWRAVRMVIAGTRMVFEEWRQGWILGILNNVFGGVLRHVF